MKQLFILLLALAVTQLTPAAEPDAVGSPGEAVTKTLSAPGAGVAWVIYGYKWSFSAAPAAGTTLTISDGATEVYRDYITSAGPSKTMSLPLPARCTGNSAVTATLSAPGGAIIGTVNVFALKEEEGTIQ